MTITRNSQKPDAKKSSKDKKKDYKKLSKKRVVESSDSSDNDDDFIEDTEDEYETVSESEEASYEETEEDDEDDSEDDEDSSKKSSKKAAAQKKDKFVRKMADFIMNKNKKESKDKKKAAVSTSKKSSGKSSSKKSPKKIVSKKSPKKSKKSKSSEKDEDEDEDDEDSEDDEDYDTDDADEEEYDEDEDEDDEEDEDEYDEEDEDEDDDDDRRPEIILSIDAFGGGGLHNDEYDYKEMIKEDKNETCDSDDEQMFMKESYVKLDKIVEESAESISGSPKKSKKDHEDSKKSKSKSKEKESKEESDDGDSTENKKTVEEKYKELSQLKKDLTDQLAKTPKNKILQNAIQECRTSIANLVKKERKKNAESYYKLVHKDADEKRNTNELSYFKKKLSHKEQLKVMSDLKEINSICNNDKPYRLRLLEADIPAKFKAIVLQKLNVLKMMEPNDSEYYKLKNWVDGFMRLPYGIYKNLSVCLDDGVDTCHNFIKDAKTTLDECVYGLDDAKLQILQMVGQWISNPSAMGTAIAIKGPMGTGKTTLVKEGISKILGREFAFIALGGTGDASFLEGHGYTYEGSTWGKIVSILMECKCMNPVIYFDELDKLSDTPKGEEIAGILTHLTDTTQNNQYHDKYFAEVDFDLSKCLFIFSYNDESKVNPILRDRMYRIQTKGYEQKEKMIIARQHLLPKIREQVNFKEFDVVIPDSVLEYIIGNNFCKDEQGVRNLKRCLEIIHTKLNLFRLVKSDQTIFSKDMKIDVQFPVTVTKEHVDILVKKEDPMSQSMLAMYV